LEFLTTVPQPASLSWSHKMAPEDKYFLQKFKAVTI